ncbi:unnamed protein product [Ranitomeya imitator]|uniref:Uncharacterized protein n=1 Tax=Ranitomeya imitator TaxID=111125 RepID=A0ABN9LYF9_9NEOB|nr:unnamed protein product [Ranitomeya imitator]
MTTAGIMFRIEENGHRKRTTVVPGPAERPPLQYNYTFWYSRRTPGRPTSSQSYEQNIQADRHLCLCECQLRYSLASDHGGTVLEILQPHGTSRGPDGHSDFHLFKEGIKPMWEDDANKNGGKWIIRLRKGLASRCWEESYSCHSFQQAEKTIRQAGQKKYKQNSKEELSYAEQARPQERSREKQSPTLENIDRKHGSKH